MSWQYRLRKRHGWWWIERARWGLWFWPFVQFRADDNAVTSPPGWVWSIWFWFQKDYPTLSAWRTSDGAKEKLRKILEQRSAPEEIVYIRVDEVAA